MSSFVQNTMKHFLTPLSIGRELSCSLSRLLLYEPDGLQDVFVVSPERIRTVFVVPLGEVGLRTQLTLFVVPRDGVRTMLVLLPDVVHSVFDVPYDEVYVRYLYQIRPIP